MSNLKTANSALTAAILVTGISLAFAQTEDQQPANPMVAATAATPAVTPSEQTPADPNALPPAETTVQLQQQQPAVNDPARATAPVDPTAPLPSDTMARPASDNSYPTPTATSTTTTTTPAASPRYEPAPRADRN